MGVEWTNRYIALEREDTYGEEPGIIKAISIDAAGQYDNGASGTWTAGTKASRSGGGFGAHGTVTTNNSGGISEIKILNHGQEYTSAPTITLAGIGTEQSAATLGLTMNDASNGITYGEADDESLKQTFDLLTRSDMSRQVASKAVTSTQYGEGTINLAVQPDDFMGNILYAFLPATEEGSAFVDSITIGGTNTGYTGAAGLYDLVFTDTFVIACDTTNADAKVVTADTTKIAVGQKVSGTGIPAGATVLSITNSTTFELSANATADGSNVSVTFDTNPTERATAVARTDGTKIAEVYVTNPGKGYKIGSDGTRVPTISASIASGSNATLTAVMGAARKHVFNEPVLTTHAYPSYTMRVGRGDREHTFTGMVASKLTMSANLNEYVMASVDWIGKNEESTSTLRTDVDFAGLAVDALHFADAEVYFQDNASKTVKVQQISLEININRDLDSAYAVGNRSFTRAPPTTLREITGTMEFNEVIYSDIADYVNEPTYDDLTGDSVHKIQDGGGKPAIRLKFTAEGALTDFIQIDLFNVRFEAPEASVSGRDPNRMSVGFQAFYDATSNGAGKAIEVKMLGSEGAVRDSNYSSG